MKTRRLISIVAAVVALALLAPCAAFAEEAPSASDVTLHTYRDAEHTDPIEDDFTPGEKVYYVLDCAKGYFATELRIDNTTYIDGKCFIPGDGELDIYVTYYLAGDIDNSGTVNAKDVVTLMKYIVGVGSVFWENYGNILLDFDRNGKINAKDVLGLMHQLVTGKAHHGGLQDNILGIRAATSNGDAVFALTNASAGKWGDCKVIRSKAALQSILAGAVEPKEGEKEFIASPSDSLDAVTAETFKESTLIAVYTGTEFGRVAFEGAYFVNETLVPIVSVYDAIPGTDCDPYEAHVVVIAVAPIDEDRAVEPILNLYYPL